MKFLVTGCAGFIGSAVLEKLIYLGHDIVGIDNFNSYYDPELKYARLNKFKRSDFELIKLDISNRPKIEELFRNHEFDVVIHLAAQAGVRYSIENPHSYCDANLQGFLNILEGCRQSKIKHLVYASSSSVYGIDNKTPYSVDMDTNRPVSLYAATKKANELMAYSYSHLYNLPTTGLRFFTVYGPWGRPDMALFKFSNAILSSNPIEIYNEGQLSRDFTYIDDIVEGLIRISDIIPKTGSNGHLNISSQNSSPYSLYNIGYGKPVPLLGLIDELEKCLGKKAIKTYLPMQKGDVYTTWADTEDLFRVIDYRPLISIEEGVKRFADWYCDYYL